MYENKLLNFERPADFMISIDGKDNSRVTVDAYYDSHYYVYGDQLGMIDRNDEYRNKGNNIFNPIRLCLSKEIYLPEEKKTIPFSDYETGKLSYGDGNPENSDYNSLADFSAGENSVEIKIPWQLLNVMDPSTKSVMGDFYEKDGIEPEKLEGIYLGMTVIKENKDKESEIPMSFYTWDNWETPSYHERLKKSYYIVKDAFEKYSEMEGDY